jgi:hypothetical protein
MATNIKAVVRQTGSILTQQSTLTLKNTLKDEIALREIINVIEGSPNNGDTLVYNSILNKYEVKPVSISANNITGLDGGTF